MEGGNNNNNNTNQQQGEAGLMGAHAQYIKGVGEVWIQSLQSYYIHSLTCINHHLLTTISFLTGNHWQYQRLASLVRIGSAG